MAIPASNTVSALFVSDQPDWSSPPVVTYSYDTRIFTGRNGLEQRARKRDRAVLRIEWIRRGLTKAEADERAARDLAEAAAPCIVPFWTDMHLLEEDMATDDNIRIDQARREEFFDVGEWVYLDDGTTQQFRQIATVTDSVNFVLETASSPVRFSAGDRIYPCKTCERVLDNSQQFNRHLQAFDFRRVFRTIGEQ